MIQEQWQTMNTQKPPGERLAGIRAAYLFKQLIEDGLTQVDIAEAIGCNVSTVNKLILRLEELSSGVAQKGLRDDVMQGIYYGLGVRIDFLFMPTPKGYPKHIRLKGGDTRPAGNHELDHKDFRVIPHAEVEQARDKRERVALRADVDELRSAVRALEGHSREQDSKLDKILALLGAEDRAKSVR